MSELLCQGWDCSRRERCSRFLRIEEETKKMVIGLPWSAHKMCRPGFYETEKDYQYFIDISACSSIE